MKTAMPGFKLPGPAASLTGNLVFFIIFSTRLKYSWGKEEDDTLLLPTIIEAEQMPIQSRSARQFLTRNAGPAKQNPEELVSDIHCMSTTNTKTFTSFLRLPQNFLSPPVLENVGSESIDPTQCLITRTNVDGIFALDLSQMESCGVSQCENGGELWMCVTIRFPMLPGLKLPEDEVIDIKCKPQDPAISGSNVINFQENAVEQRSPTIYLGGGQDFLSEIGLFRKLPGTELFASRVKSGSSIELGENVQLRSIVRSGDGWNFAKITDVMVHRVHNGQALQDTKNTAELVFSNGCRNPSYRPLAPFNPWRDSSNGLIINFDFRVFMFQEMLSGDSIMISAKVIACVEEIDCAPVNCGDTEDPGYGKRKKRSLYQRNSTASTDNIYMGKTKNWEENLELKIRMPPDLLVSQTNSKSMIENNHESRPLRESECKIYLIVTLSVALTFCVLSATIVVVACFKKYQESKVTSLALTLENEEKEQMARTEVRSVNSTHQISGKSVFDITMPSHCNLIGSNFQYQPSSGPPSARPVTVRSVKRRDKAKIEERRLSQAGNGNKIQQRSLDDRTTAVMV